MAEDTFSQMGQASRSIINLFVGVGAVALILVFVVIIGAHASNVDQTGKASTWVDQVINVTLQFVGQGYDVLVLVIIMLVAIPLVSLFAGRIFGLGGGA